MNFRVLINIFICYFIFCFAKLNKSSKEIKQEFNKHKLDSILPILDDELLCKCTNPSCDKDFVEIIGVNYSGICRAHKEGVCRKAVQFDEDGQITDITLSCIHYEELVPIGRPFVCQATKYLNQIIECCSNVSFCNNFEGVIVPKKLTKFQWRFVLLIVIILFLTICLTSCIFWCSSNYSKKFLYDLLNTCVEKPLNRSVSTYITNEEETRLKSLLDDLDSTTQSTGSGAGVPMLAERTIARQITLNKIIGHGRFGKVFLGEWRGDKVAVKIFSTREEESWKRETEIYCTNMLRHSNVLRWISSDNKDTGFDTQLWLITEYCSLGSLYEFLYDYEINQVLAVQLIRGCVLGLAYLHTEVPGNDLYNFTTKPGIAHRDLKSRNIMVKSDFTCVIGDLGLAVRCQRGEIDLPNHIRGGTMRYSAPEFLNQSYAKDSFFSYTRMDIYALSLIIWEICRRISSNDCMGCFQSYPREIPYYEYVAREPTFEEMRECVCINNFRPVVPQKWHSFPIMRELIRIMCECWSSNPNSRLTALNIRFAIDKLIHNYNLKITLD